MLSETTDSMFPALCGVPASLLSNRRHTCVVSTADHALAGFASWVAERNDCTWSRLRVARNTQRLRVVYLICQDDTPDRGTVWAPAWQTGLTS